MKHNIRQSDIDNLEKELLQFSKNWERNQITRNRKWRKFLLIGFVATLIMGFVFPQLWWIGIIVIAYSAGSLFVLIDQEARTTSQILEHKRQLKLARLLLKFNATL